jgi:hypothetical protein
MATSRLDRAPHQYLSLPEAAEYVGQSVKTLSSSRGQEGLQVTQRESSAPRSVSEFRHHEGVPLLNVQAARALLRLLEGARERRQQQEEHRRAS